MAKQGKILPARRPRGEESLLLRSAESLGRVIGSLQRQLDSLRPALEEKGTGGDGKMKATANRTSKRGKKKTSTRGKRKT